MRPDSSFLQVQAAIAGFRHRRRAISRIFSIGWAAVAALFFATTCAQADVSVTGFGSLVGGGLLQGDGYIADFPNLAIYGHNGSSQFGPTDNGWLTQESRLGIQGMTRLDDATRVTLQVLARAVEQYQPKTEWLYVSHDLTDNIDVQGGKMRLPVYMYSDKMDVGFAYPWVRVPSDAYSLETVNYNGGRINYLTGTEETRLRLSAYTGTADEPDSKLMSYLFNTPIHRHYKSIAGTVADISHGIAELRLSYLNTQMQQSTSDPANAFRNANFNEEFYDAALQLQFGNLTLLGEWNKDRPFYESWLTSAIYHFDRNSLYVVHSRFILDLPWEKHNQTSVGIRRDIGTNMDVKFDITRFYDHGLNPFTGATNPVVKMGDGNATIASASFDFIF